MFSLSAVMPAYNEEANIAAMIDDVAATISQVANDYEIVVVDDGSRDATAQEVRQAADRHANVRLVQHEVNQGYGAAVFTGFTSSTKDLIFFTDADRQFDLNEIRKLLPFIQQADLVIGVRAPRRDPFMRRLNGWGWSTLVNLLFGYTAHDVDCAFKLFRRSIVDDIRERITSRGATFSAEFLVLAKRAGYTIHEVSLAGHRPRVAGSQTGARPAVIVRAFRELIRFRWRLWFQPAPSGAAPDSVTARKNA
jgi:glycosyltransferase involved in cell wall biosynthesis